MPKKKFLEYVRENQRAKKGIINTIRVYIDDGNIVNNAPGEETGGGGGRGEVGGTETLLSRLFLKLQNLDQAINNRRTRKNLDQPSRMPPRKMEKKNHYT